MKETKKSIYNLILLDESGSMFADRDRVISNFNELLDDIKYQSQQEKTINQYLSLISFNGKEIKPILNCEKIKEARHLKEEDYNPNSSTPLFDALGYSIQTLQKQIKGKNTNVITTVFTDGMENSSVEFTAEILRKIIKDLEGKNWSFSYIGADHDVTEQAKSINIDKTMKFSKTRAGFKRSLDVQKEYRNKVNKLIQDDAMLSVEITNKLWKDTLREYEGEEL